jgi:hypothetical protein
MFHRHEFAEWRSFDITQELLKVIEEQATSEAQKILTNTSFDRDRDQFAKGVIAGLSLVAGWQPEYIQDENHPEQDALSED